MYGARIEPIIVTALMGQDDFVWANQLRAQHMPPERNHLAAHITLFHQLPASSQTRLHQRLADGIAAAQPDARLSQVMRLRRGVAFRIDSPVLLAIRQRLADTFHQVLVPPDQAKARLHMTIQNKVTPAQAEALFQSISRTFRPRHLSIIGLASWRYMGGPWEHLSSYRFST